MKKIIQLVIYIIGIIIIMFMSVYGMGKVVEPVINDWTSFMIPEEEWKGGD